MKLAPESALIDLVSYVMDTGWLHKTGNTKVKEQLSHVTFLQTALGLPKCGCEGDGHFFDTTFIAECKAEKTQKMVGEAASFRHRELVLRHGKKVISELSDALAVTTICAELVSHCMESGETAKVDAKSEAAVCKVLLWYVQHTPKSFYAYQTANLIVAMQNDCSKPKVFSLTVPSLWFWSELIMGKPVGTENYHEALNPQETVSC